MTSPVAATLPTYLPSYLPSPSEGVWHLGPVPLRGYAFCILAGIVVAVLVTERRWRARGGLDEQVLDITLWAVPFGIVGGRLYHLITSPQAYFGAGGDPVAALYIWRGGLGIWGAVALGALGAWIGCRRVGARFSAFADALAPGLLLAQAIGRFGNWFNQELYGRPTTLPWGLRIDPAHRLPGYAGVATYHPTFLYEALWDVAAALVLVVAERRLRLGHGRTFLAYALLYTAGRAWIEALRIDPANHLLGLRLNDWTCLVVGVAAIVGLVVSARRHPGPTTDVLRPGVHSRAGTDGAGTDGAGTDGVGTDGVGLAGVGTDGAQARTSPGEQPAAGTHREAAASGDRDRPSTM